MRMTSSRVRRHLSEHMANVIQSMHQQGYFAVYSPAGAVVGRHPKRVDAERQVTRLRLRTGKDYEIRSIGPMG